jgi:acyl-CoA synthetase (NDP forming)
MVEGTGERSVVTGSRPEGILTEAEVYELLDRLGIPTVAHFLWDPRRGEDPTPGLGKLQGSTVVLKVQSRDIPHKSDVGGVRFCPRDPQVVQREARGMLQEVSSRAPEAEIAGILVMERVPYEAGLGRELLVAWRWDRAFGPVLMVAPGGVLTEWFDEISGEGSLAVLPAGLSRDEARRRLLRRPALRVFLEPSRLHPDPPIHPDALLDLLEALAGLEEVHTEQQIPLTELELNPVVFHEGRLVPLDGLGRVGKREQPRPRRPLEKIRHLLYPRSAVVVGASCRSLNPGRIILRNLKEAEGILYGHLYAIHPKAPRIDGIPCSPTLRELPEKVDLAVVSVPAEGAVEAISEICREDRAESVILIPGGFGERGRTDLAQAIKDAIAEARRKGRGPVLVGGNCLGIVSRGHYNTFFLPQYKLPFRGSRGENLAAVSQSGAYLVTLSSNLDGIVFPRASISYGNEMDLTLADFVEYYLREEPEVHVLACYVEGFHPLDGRRLVELARTLREQGRVLIVFKGGKTPLGAKATQSHTASMAGDYRVAKALLEAEAAVVTETLNQFEDFVKIFTLLDGRRPRGRRVGIISNAGFECSAVLDRLYDLELARLSEATRARLREVLPGIAHTDNPVDTTPMATTEDFIAAVQALLEDEGVDSLIVSAVPVTPTLEDLAPDLSGMHPENIYSLSSFPQELIKVFSESRKPMVAAVDSGRLYDPLVILLQRAGIPVYRKIDRASRALSRFTSRWVQVGDR